MTLVLSPDPEPHADRARSDQVHTLDQPLAGSMKRAISPYSTRAKALRTLWVYGGQVLFSLTFHNWYGVRRSLLRVFGSDIGVNVRIRPTVRIEQPWNLTIGDDTSVGDHAILYCLGKVSIGRRSSISQYAHLCAGTHDYTRADIPLLRPPIVIGDEVWIAADVFVGPGVTVADGCVVGARSSVFKDLPAWKVCAGSPARPIKDRVLVPAP